jgi:hypothetical protein
MNEHQSRRPSYRKGVNIRLADDQMWTFPAPPKASEASSSPFGSEYIGLVHAIMESEDASERGLADLAFAIFLLGVNYSLTPSEFEHLLNFTPESSEASIAQSALHDIANEHVSSFLKSSNLSWVGGRVVPAPGRFSRFLAWLRSRSPFPWWSFDSRS